jgi:hypothetical protein
MLKTTGEINLNDHVGQPCPYCGQKMTGPPFQTAPGVKQRHGKAMVTRDHIIPRSRIRGEPAQRIIIVCRRCNSDKGDMTLDEWVVWLDDRFDIRRARVRALLDVLWPHLEGPSLQVVQAKRTMQVEDYRSDPPQPVLEENQEKEIY